MIDPPTRQGAVCLHDCQQPFHLHHHSHKSHNHHNPHHTQTTIPIMPITPTTTSTTPVTPMTPITTTTTTTSENHTEETHEQSSFKPDDDTRPSPPVLAKASWRLRSDHHTFAPRMLCKTTRSWNLHTFCREPTFKVILGSCLVRVRAAGPHLEAAPSPITCLH